MGTGDPSAGGSRPGGTSAATAAPLSRPPGGCAKEPAPQRQPSTASVSGAIFASVTTRESPTLAPAPSTLAERLALAPTWPPGPRIEPLTVAPTPTDDPGRSTVSSTDASAAIRASAPTLTRRPTTAFGSTSAVGWSHGAS